MLINLYEVFLNSLSGNIIYSVILGLKRLSESNESLQLLTKSNILNLVVEFDIIEINNLQLKIEVLIVLDNIINYLDSQSIPILVSKKTFIFIYFI